MHGEKVNSIRLTVLHEVADDCRVVVFKRGLKLTMFMISSVNCEREWQQSSLPNIRLARDRFMTIHEYY